MTTNATPGPVEVTQADREAAWPFYRAAVDYPATHEFKANWMLGHLDDAAIVQAFARHRIEAARPVQSELVEAIPRDIIEQVLAMGRVEWGATAEHDDAGHLSHLANSLRITREHFGFDNIPVQMHGLYLEGTETVLCHTGISPNSPVNAQALTGAWNWLHDQCAALSQYEDKETDNG